jgi:hypothetical protein
MAEMARNGMTSLPAIGFMLATVAMVVLATVMWFVALVTLLAVVGLRRPLRSRQGRMIRMARRAGSARP